MKRVLLIFSLLAAATTAHASLVVLSNIAGGGTLPGPIIAPTTFWGAVGLQTSTVAAQFVSMQVYVRSDNMLPTTLSGGIYDDDAGAPDTLQAAFTAESLPMTFTPPGVSALYTMETAVPFTLNASTNYWFVLNTSAAILPVFWMTDGVDGIGTPPTAASGYTSLGVMSTLNSGTNWSASGFYPSVAITLEESAVPEPGTVLSAAAGLIAVVAMRRRRRA